MCTSGHLALAAVVVLAVLLIAAFWKKGPGSGLGRTPRRGAPAAPRPSRNHCPCRCASAHHCVCLPGCPCWASGPCQAEYQAAHPGSRGYPY